MMILYTLGYTILIAMGMNTMFSIPLYARYIAKYKKPFNCIFCMAFWVCVIIGAFSLQPLPLIYWMGVTLATPYLSALLRKIMDNLPTHF